MSGRKAFEDLKQAVANAVDNAYFDVSKLTCVFADSSEAFYSLLITQCHSDICDQMHNDMGQPTRTAEILDY